MVLAHGPCPLAKPGVAKRKGAGPGGGSPGQHKERSDAEGRGNPVPRRSVTLAHARGDPLGDCRQEEKTRTVCSSHGAREAALASVALGN